MHQMEDDFVAGALKLGHTEEKLKRSLQSWKNSQAMGLTVPMPMPILPWPFRWPISRSIIQMFSLMLCSNYSSSDYLTDALQFDFKVAPLSINTIPYRDKFQDRKIYLRNEKYQGTPERFSVLDH